MASNDGSHPCITTGCDAVVPFDDEPWCFDHSPDSGSSVMGYSYAVQGSSITLGVRH